MADLYTVAGWKFYIGEVITIGKVDLVASDFTGMDFDEVDGWETMGTFGDAAAIITTALINRNRDVKQKGTRSAGDMTNRFSLLMGVAPDVGQLALIAAEKTKFNYGIKIEADDKGAGGGALNTTFLFGGLVTSASIMGGQANGVQLLESTVGINSNIVRVAATAGT